eukprot:COSAG01_NODE_59067_length_302_cov_0.940887_1_plen_75_part_10
MTSRKVAEVSPAVSTAGQPLSSPTTGRETRQAPSALAPSAADGPLSAGQRRAAANMAAPAAAPVAAASSAAQQLR